MSFYDFIRPIRGYIPFFETHLSNTNNGLKDLFFNLLPTELFVEDSCALTWLSVRYTGRTIPHTMSTGVHPPSGQVGNHAEKCKALRY